MAERFFGATIITSTGRVVPVRLIGEQHVREDLGFIPSFADWVRCIRPEPWMGRAQPIHRDVDPFAAASLISSLTPIATKPGHGAGLRRFRSPAMADFYTHFSCLLDVGSPDNAARALELYQAFMEDAAREEVPSDGFPSVDPAGPWCHKTLDL